MEQHSSFLLQSPGLFQYLCPCTGKIALDPAAYFVSSKHMLVQVVCRSKWRYYIRYSESQILFWLTSRLYFVFLYIHKFFSSAISLKGWLQVNQEGSSAISVS